MFIRFQYCPVNFMRFLASHTNDRYIQFHGVFFLRRLSLFRPKEELCFFQQTIADGFRIAFPTLPYCRTSGACLSSLPNARTNLTYCRSERNEMK